MCCKIGSSYYSGKSPISLSIMFDHESISSSSTHTKKIKIKTKTKIKAKTEREKERNHSPIRILVSKIVVDNIPAV